MSNRTHTTPGGHDAGLAHRRLRASARPLAVLFSAGALLVLPPSPVALSHASAPTATTTTADTAQHVGKAWQGAWSTSVQQPGRGLFPNWSQQGFKQQSVRQVVRVSTGGSSARLKISNRYGTAPLTVTGATVARTDKGAAVHKGSSLPLTFDKKGSVTVPAGGEVYTDAAPLKVKALESLTITLYFNEPTGPSTYHMAASQTAYRAAGDQRADDAGKAFTETTASWYYLANVEVKGAGPGLRKGVVTFGDSITDGMGSTIDASNRYPDDLAERFVAEDDPRTVLNQGISGNMVTVGTPGTGESAVDRFKKDVLGEPGIRTVVIMEGINDIGLGGMGQIPDVSAEKIIAGHKELVRQAHAKGLKVIGSTLIPFKGAGYYTDRGETKREAFNEWLLNSGVYDEVIDLDKVVADPADPDRLLPAYDSGDHLHPSDAGYRAMAEALDLDEL